VCYPRETLAVLAEFDLQSFNLSFEQAVLLVSVVRGLLQLVDFSFQVLEMLLLAFAEGPLCRAILCLALLYEEIISNCI
jgi:hypothetical protein